MPTTPVVSVLLPTYNSERYIKHSLRSILNQSYRDFEIIVVNDGSSDRTGEIIESIAKQDQRVKPFTTPNQGICHALNLGFSIARGRLIARMDGDDVCVRNRFMRQVQFLNETPSVDLVGSSVLLIDPKGRPLVTRHNPPTHKEIEEKLLRGNGSSVIHPTVMCRREVFEKLGGYNPKFNRVEDLDFFLRASVHFRLANILEPLLCYRQHPSSCNHLHLEEQVRLVNSVLEVAYKERQLPSPPLVEAWNKPPWPTRYRKWAWANLLNEQKRLRALRLLCVAVSHEPFCRENFQILRSLVKSAIFRYPNW